MATLLKDPPGVGVYVLTSNDTLLVVPGAGMSCTNISGLNGATLQANYRQITSAGIYSAAALLTGRQNRVMNYGTTSAAKAHVMGAAAFAVQLRRNAVSWNAKGQVVCTGFRS